MMFDLALGVDPHGLDYISNSSSTNIQLTCSARLIEVQRWERREGWECVVVVRGEFSSFFLLFFFSFSSSSQPVSL